MTTPFRGTGTDPAETRDSILIEELKKLQDARTSMKEDNQKYIDTHPELNSLLDEFVAAAIRDKPSDLVNFGSEFFGKLRDETRAAAIAKGPRPVVFAGPSGVGKGTLVNLLMTRYPGLFGFSVSHTTRAPRPGEENGIHYNFVKLEDMEAAIARGEFVEYARVHTNMYGTSVASVEKVRSAGKICILDIDVQGVRNVKKSSLQCKYVFILPPSIEELESRLRGRGTETEEKVQIRMKTAHEEIAFGNEDGNFDALVTNTDLEVAVAELVGLLKSWYPEVDVDAFAAVKPEEEEVEEVVPAEEK